MLRFNFATLCPALVILVVAAVMLAPEMPRLHTPPSDYHSGTQWDTSLSGSAPVVNTSTLPYELRMMHNVISTLSGHPGYKVAEHKACYNAISEQVPESILNANHLPARLN